MFRNIFSKCADIRKFILCILWSSFKVQNFCHPLPPNVLAIPSPVLPLAKQKFLDRTPAYENTVGYWQIFRVCITMGWGNITGWIIMMGVWHYYGAGIITTHSTAWSHKKQFDCTHAKPARHVPPTFFSLSTHLTRCSESRASPVPTRATPPSPGPAYLCARASASCAWSESSAWPLSSALLAHADQPPPTHTHHYFENILSKTELKNKKTTSKQILQF